MIHIQGPVFCRRGRFFKLTANYGLISAVPYKLNIYSYAKPIPESAQVEVFN
jgi:hypothetical protein